MNCSIITPVMTRDTLYSRDKVNVAIKDSLSDKYIDDGAQGQKGTEGDSIFRVFPFYDHQGYTNQGAGEGAKDKSKNYALYAAKSTDHREELDVASPHALPFREKLITRSDEEENPPSHKNPEEGLFIRKGDPDEGENKAKQEASKTEYVRNYLEVEVNEGDDNQQCDKGHVYAKLRGQAVSAVQGEKQKGRDQLNNKVARGNGCAAMPAVTFQYEVAAERDVIVEGYAVIARRAMRTGAHNRFSLRYPVNTDIQEASHNSAEYKRKNRRDHHRYLLWKISVS